MLNSKVTKLDLAIIAAIGIFCVLPISGQKSDSTLTQNNDQAQILKQLLFEFRELRIALQRLAFTNSRVQLLVERLRIEQAHFDSLRGRLEEISSQLSDAEAGKQITNQRIKDMEESLDHQIDPNGRQELESRIKTMKLEINRTGLEEERQRSRRAILESEFQTCQVRLAEINSQIDDMTNQLKYP